MEHIVATDHRFGPTRIGVQIGAEHGKPFAGIARSSLTQHSADIVFTREVAHRGACFMPRRQHVNQTMGAEKARTPCHQNLRHITLLSNH